MGRYTEQAKVEAYLNRSLNTQESAILDDTIDVVSRTIVDYCNRDWLGLDEGVDDYSSAEERLYDSQGRNELIVDDLINVIKIELIDADGNVYSELASTDYILYPLNADTYNSIFRLNGFWPWRARSVKITGTFGAGECPNQVQAVCTALVAEYILRAAQTGDFTRESIEGYTYELASAREREDKIHSIMRDLDGFRNILI